eukprot:COSAG01_NODE_21526_length_898_cov_0.966208_1_plen_72_part_10
MVFLCVACAMQVRDGMTVDVSATFVEAGAEAGAAAQEVLPLQRVVAAQGSWECPEGEAAGGTLTIDLSNEFA